MPTLFTTHIICKTYATTQVAVATLQILLIATRGHRAYTSKELDCIFLEVGTEFFRSLESISAFVEMRRLKRLTAIYNRDPDRRAPPETFSREQRYNMIRIHAAHSCICPSTTEPNYCKSTEIMTSPTRHQRTTIWHGVVLANSNTAKRDCPTRLCTHLNSSNEEGITVLSAQVPLKQATSFTSKWRQGSL